MRYPSLISLWCNGSIPVSKTVDKSSNLLGGANWFFGVTDSMIDFGSIGKGSNPLRTTMVSLVVEAGRSAKSTE